MQERADLIKQRLDEMPDERVAEIPCYGTPEFCRERARQMQLEFAFGGPFMPGGVVVKGAAAAESLLGRVIGWLFGRGAAAGAEAVKVGEYTLTRTVASKLAERPYLSSPNALREIMAAGKPVADPGGVAGALRWDVAGAFRGSAGTWELVVEPKAKMILHWLFKSAPKAAP